jgi:hypothetical protein
MESSPAPPGWLALWRSPARLLSLARPLLLLQLCGFAFLVAGTHGAFVRMPDPPTTTDFASFYAAGMLANRGMPEAAYDEAAHRAAEAQAIAPGVEEKRFLNPPVFLLVCAPLARLPYLVAFVLFEAVTFAVWLALATRIAGGGALAATALAAVPSVWWALGWGQNSFLSASLMAGGTLLLAESPFLAGLAFGALCFKPHFGVMLPVALLAGRQWRAIAGGACGVAALGALTTACFGVAPWRAFLAMALHARATIETGIQLAGHVDAGGAARLLGLKAGASWAVQAAEAAASALCVARLWIGSASRSGVEAPRAGLIAGTVAAMPFVLFYDLVMAATAAAWLVRAARRAGPRRGETGTLALLVVLDLIAFPAASLLHLAVGTLVAPALLWLAWRRAPTPRPVEK